MRLTWTRLGADFRMFATVVTPAEFQRLLTEALAPHVHDQGHTLLVQGLRSIRDFSAWLAPQGVRQESCWGNRDGLEAPHSFTYKRRSDLTAAEKALLRPVRAAVRAGFTPATDAPEDVFCLVKTYMRDKHLQQAPVLVLPIARRNRVHGLAPTTVEAVAVSPGRANELQAMATLFEGGSYRLIRAATALRELAVSVHGPPLAPGWLAVPPIAHPPVEETLNEYFGHLPEISWHLRAVFHRV